MQSIKTITRNTNQQFQTDETFYELFGEFQSRIVYHIDGEPLQHVKTYRYLGLDIDSNMSFHTHLNRITNGIQKNLYALYSVIRNNISLNPISISKIYQMLSKPKVDYGLIYYYPYDTKDKLQILQNKFLRAMIPSKRSIPLDILHKISKTEYIQDSYKKLTLRLYCRAQHCSTYHPLYNTYNKYKQELNIYITNRYSRYRIAETHYITKHPLYAAEQLQIFGNMSMVSTTMNVKRYPITSTPLYQIKVPTNYIVDEEESIPSNKFQMNTLNIFVDGSCHPNPGIAAAAAYIPPTIQFNEDIQTLQYDKPTTISTAEIGAVQIATDNALNYKSDIPSDIFTIKIWSDSKSTLQYLNFTAFPKYQNTKEEIQKVFQNLKTIQCKYPNHTVHFKKIKAHSNHPHNDKVDKLANNAAKSGGYDRNKLGDISYQVQLTQIHQSIMKNRKQQWAHRKNKNAIIYKYNRWYTNHLYHILFKNMNIHQIGMATRIISEHIELNQYLHKYELKNDENIIQSSPNCSYCNEIESVEHFLLNCNKYQPQRTKLFNNITKIWSGYNNGWNISIGTLLFPYIIKLNNIRQISNDETLMIWKEILSYTRSTNRFKNLFKINLDKLV